MSKAIYNVANNIKVAGNTASYTYEDKVKKQKVTLSLLWKNVRENIEGIFQEIENKEEGATVLIIPICIDWKHE